MSRETKDLWEKRVLWVTKVCREPTATEEYKAHRAHGVQTDTTD